ncbi:uncharacterized protein M421DRAFT_197997 [Didymella exigua CBS 183.55]|uniref:Uncharacterized protein n=1 Tax=Didymella exigua CBS 183.55 TaxID=1150837 RepID=A0A6A5S025_9PLEO|nr:uncharacterized protein M421DRAFT_197997 [Didymella exigua CBS 183.55]KAF1933472.1 hypothetical protein M421DRAFT_197997 [Didymella exigua CBS 183.55]
MWSPIYYSFSSFFVIATLYLLVHLSSSITISLETDRLPHPRNFSQCLAATAESIFESTTDHSLLTPTSSYPTAHCLTTLLSGHYPSSLR